MLTPKIRKTNLVKDHTGFKVGGYARSRAFGTRVYKVIGINISEEDVRYEWVNELGQRVVSYRTVQKEELTLMKIGETNKGKFKFTNSKPFTTNNHNLTNPYYPAKGV